MDIKTLKETLPYLFKANITPMIWGHHATGKSMALDQFILDQGGMIKNIRLGQAADAADIMGLFDYVQDENGKNVASSYLIPKYLHELITFCEANPDKIGVIFFDEVNRVARKDLLQAIFEPVLDRRLHGTEFPPNLFPICAANPATQDYIVLNMDDKAFLSRFCHIKLTPTKAEWFKYAKGNAYDNDLLTFLKTQPELLDSSNLEDFAISDLVAPDRRAWSAMNRLLKTEIPQKLLKELGFGLVGTSGTMAYISFLENQVDKPFTAEEILTKYSKIKPKIKEYASSEGKSGGRQDIIKITCENLIEHVNGLSDKKKFTKKQGSALMDFLKDIPAEHAFLTSQKIYFKPCCQPLIDADEEFYEKLAKAKKSS